MVRPVDRGSRAAARRPLHPRRQPPQLSRRRDPRRRRPAAHLLHRHAARLPREPAAPGLPPAHRVHPGQSLAPGTGRDQAGAARAGRGPHRGDFPRGPLQPRGPARSRPARSRGARAPRRRARGAHRRPGHLRGTAGPALLPPAAAPSRRPLRPPPRPARTAPPWGRPRRARRGHAPDHGRDRSAPRPSPRVTDPGGTRWGGRFAERMDPSAQAFTASLDFDRRLWPWDIDGSRAWARALARAGLLTEAELAALLAGLDAVRAELPSGRFPFRREREDIHLNIERRLTELAGPVGGKLHTGRSRNDQIALDERLYLRDMIGHADAGIREVQAALVARAEEHMGAPMPGYTHLQRAQPLLLSHHLLAFVFMLDRDRQRLRACRERANVLPLGASALAGAAFPIDREALARDLGFAAPSANSLDAISDRDHLIEFLAAAAIFGMHLSRLAADLTLWATSECGFVEFDDKFATGSSIMPQKKNPDVAELLRGKTGRLYGNLTALLTVMKGLPLTYNSDMQEDKHPLFDTVDTLEAALRVVPPMLRTLTFRLERMREAAGANFSTATDLADYLVRKGLPFREAHEVVGGVVRHGLAQGRELAAMTLDELRRFSPLIGADVHAALTVEASLAARAVIGGTAPDAVKQALAHARALVGPEPRR